jgi:hypothetical protein
VVFIKYVQIFISNAAFPEKKINLPLLFQLFCLTKEVAEGTGAKCIVTGQIRFQKGPSDKEHREKRCNFLVHHLRFRQADILPPQQVCDGTGQWPVQ